MPLQEEELVGELGGGVNAEHRIARLVPAEGVEPTRPCGHWILSPARLPIPPRRLCPVKCDRIKVERKSLLTA